MRDGKINGLESTCGKYDGKNMATERLSRECYTVRRDFLNFLSQAYGQFLNILLAISHLNHNRILFRLIGFLFVRNRISDVVIGFFSNRTPSIIGFRFPNWILFPRNWIPLFLIGFLFVYIFYPSSDTFPPNQIFYPNYLILLIRFFSALIRFFALPNRILF